MNYTIDTTYKKGQLIYRIYKNRIVSSIVVSVRVTLIDNLNGVKIKEEYQLKTNEGITTVYMLLADIQKDYFNDPLDIIDTLNSSLCIK